MCVSCSQTTPYSGHSDTTTTQSRARIYDSTSELAADSPLIVTGKVLKTNVTRDIDGSMDSTLLDVDVAQTIKGTADGDIIIVRQTGSEE